RPGRKGGVDAEELEGSRDQKRIKRRNPRRRPGVSVERVGVAISGSERTAHPAHFVAKSKVVLDVGDAVSMRQRDVQHANDQPGPENGARGGKNFSGAGGLRDGAKCIQAGGPSGYCTERSARQRRGET